MKKFYSMLAVFMFAAVFCAGTQAYAGDAYKYHKKEFGTSGKLFALAHLVIQHAEYLGLTQAQIGKIKDLKLKTKKNMIMEKAQIEVLELDVKSAMDQDVINIKDVDKLIDKKYDLKKAGAKELVEAYSELRNILNQNQRKMLDGLTKERFSEPHPGYGRPSGMRATGSIRGDMNNKKSRW